MSSTWWGDRPLRIYHPNVREKELADFDAAGFVADSSSVGAEAVVVSAGGIYAFYPSEVEHHYVSPVIGNRDLLGEIVGEAGKIGLRVIARVDFSKARESVLEKHPRWFMRDPEGDLHRTSGSTMASTCPNTGYQNQDFAHKVLSEIATRYAVAGFHLNAGGFHGFDCRCAACVQEVGELKGADLLRVRADMYGRQLLGYYRVIQEALPGGFFMGELPGPEYTDWARGGGYRFSALADSFSQLLLTTGGTRYARTSRHWPALAAEQVHGVGQRPIVNIKFNLRDAGRPLAMMPPAEFLHNAYQAIAHGAGLKLCTFSTPRNVVDTRALPAIREVFDLMALQREVLDSAVPLHQVGVLWPDSALARLGASCPEKAAALRCEIAGLFSALSGRHLLPTCVHDDHLADLAGRELRTVVVPTVLGLQESDIAGLVGFARHGGRLLVLDSPAAWLEGVPPAFPAALADAAGIKTGSSIIEPHYALVGDALGRSALAEVGILALIAPVRVFETTGASRSWLTAIESPDAATPEELGVIQSTGAPLAVHGSCESGEIIYVATGLGATYHETGHGDVALLLDALVMHGAPTDAIIRADVSPDVDITLARHSGGLLIHLVNGAAHGPMACVSRLTSLRVSVRWDGAARARMHVPDGEPVDLPCDREGDRVVVVIPELGHYAQVLIG